MFDTERKVTYILSADAIMKIYVSKLMRGADLPDGLVRAFRNCNAENISESMPAPRNKLEEIAFPTLKAALLGITTIMEGVGFYEYPDPRREYPYNRSHIEQMRTVVRIVTLLRVYAEIRLPNQTPEQETTMMEVAEELTIALLTDNESLKRRILSDEKIEWEIKKRLELQDTLKTIAIKATNCLSTDFQIAEQCFYFA
jgi:hypothetical protein